MKRIVINEKTLIPPFGEPARDLRILNKPLWLLQRDILARHCKGMLDVSSLDEIPTHCDEELVVHRDNLFFNERLVDAFLEKAKATGSACQIAFARDDRSITTHAIHLQDGIRLEGNVYVADMYYFPVGERQKPQPIVIDTEPYEMGYYSVPRYMAIQQGDLVFQIPLRVFLSIENWVHIFLANIPMGVFAAASQIENEMDRSSLRRFSQWKGEDWHLFGKKVKMVLTAFWENINPFEERWRNHFLSSKSLVKVGKNCSIDPTAIIHGPTVLGDNVYVGPGVVITNSIIGSNVNIMQGSQIMLSVVSDRSFMAFNSALFMSSIMENGMLAQNTCVQLGVVGRNTFIGANNVFTDFDLAGRPIQTFHKGELCNVGLPVLGSAVGHNCKIGSGFVVYPGRMIGSNVTIVFDDRQGLIRKNVPGGNPDDIDEETGEPRRTMFVWPHVYEPAEHRATLGEGPQREHPLRGGTREQATYYDDGVDDERSGSGSHCVGQQDAEEVHHSMKVSGATSSAKVLC
jgi:UDP-N-acetylglucosamine diphosphorylase / glucose-1-phosphate thymidylyltransferase / UDP-N-acetylgalactosamine diphosphorylase / glucosamine-1-phosphate N-acetyltransferase / galactosamine-1-phosphate N-acetyltransferase